MHYRTMTLMQRKGYVFANTFSELLNKQMLMTVGGTSYLAIITWTERTF